MKKLWIYLFIISLIINVSFFIHNSKKSNEFLEIARENSIQSLTIELVQLSVHIKKMEEQNWTNQSLNQEVFERIDDISETAMYAVNINQHVKGFSLEDNKKIGELSRVLTDKYRGNKASYTDKVYSSELQIPLKNLAINIDIALEENTYPPYNWISFLNVLNNLTLSEEENKVK